MFCHIRCTIILKLGSSVLLLYQVTILDLWQLCPSVSRTSGSLEVYTCDACDLQLWNTHPKVLGGTK